MLNWRILGIEREILWEEWNRQEVLSGSLKWDWRWRVFGQLWKERSKVRQSEELRLKMRCDLVRRVWPIRRRLIIILLRRFGIVKTKTIFKKCVLYGEVYLKFEIVRDYSTVEGYYWFCFCNVEKLENYFSLEFKNKKKIISFHYGKKEKN